MTRTVSPWTPSRRKEARRSVLMVSWRVTDCTQPHPSHPHLIIAYFTRIDIDKRCSNPVVLIIVKLRQGSGKEGQGMALKAKGLLKA